MSKLFFICVVFFCTLSPLNVLASTSTEISSCRESMFKAVDLTQAVANQVPNKVFGRFIRNGRWLPLAVEVTKLGSGNPKAGSNLLFETAKPYFQNNQTRIVRAAASCQGKCDLIRSLRVKCDEVGLLTNLLSNLNIRNGRQIAGLIYQYGGMSGVKSFINSEIKDFNRDRD